jgi:hypothetical protein
MDSDRAKTKVGHAREKNGTLIYPILFFTQGAWDDATREEYS